MSDSVPTVFIIDDDEQIRTGLTNLCQSVELNVQAFATTEEFMRAPPPRTPTCLILDVRFPGTMTSGLEFQRKLIETHNVIPVIFLTGYADVPMSVEALKLGATEFLTKPVREQDLLHAIRHAIERDRRRLERQAMREALQARFESLTDRERQIMQLVSQGFLNKQIAASLGLAEVTVKVHRSRVMQKMQAASVADLVRMADQLSAAAR